MKKIVIKVSINCQICKTDVLKAVTKLQGIDIVAVDGQKGTLTVVGDVDPVMVVRRLRKVGKVAEIVSVYVGPPKASEPKPLIVLDLPLCCNQCQLVGFKYVPYEGGGCHIL